MPETSSASTPAAPLPLLQVVGLKTVFHTDAGIARAVDGVSFSAMAGKTLAIVGESGSGKTVTALSILQLIPSPPGEIVAGEILLDGKDLLQLRPKDLQHVRGDEIGMIFQEPATSLNPVFTIGDQISEAILLHRKVARRDLKAEVLHALESVGMSDPERRISQFPHELSGGLKQRAMIAMALSCNPRLLIADEPTTALDVTIQERILDLLRRRQRELGMGLLLITHDLGVVAEMADDVVVMYAGKIVEQASATDLYERPSHPYTRGLFASLPRADAPDADLVAIEGSVPSSTSYPAGCRFKTRCPFAVDKCDEEPPLIPVGTGHAAACWFAEQFARGEIPAAHAV